MRVLAEEHVLGAAESDARGAEAAGLGGVGGGVGVRAHPERADLVAPVQEVLEVAVLLEVDHDEREGAGVDQALRPVERDEVALAQHRAADVDRPLGRG